MSIDVKENNSFIERIYHPEIDGLRAFAVIAVIINHFNNQILPNGYLGVDIFFVISGFVITSSLYQRPSKNFKDFISGFYERRIKRLVPALSVFVLITSITICLFNPVPGTSLKTGLSSLFGLSNLYLLEQSTDYFAQSTEFNVFAHTWSLGVEEQFYIVFPLLIWFSGFGRQTKNSKRNLLLIIGALAITSLIGFLYLYKTNQPAAYFLMPSRFWEMSAGCLTFITFQKKESIKNLLEKVPPLFVLALIIGVMYLPISLATASTIAVVFLTSLLITILKKGTATYTFFTNPKVVYTGLISYSLYIWHWGVLSISRWTIGIHWWSAPFQVILMLSLAIASHKYIETPLRKRNWFGKRWKTLAVGGGAIVTISGCLITLGKIPNEILYLGNFRIGVGDDYSEHLPATRNKCNSENYSLSNCLIPSKKINTQTILLIGDSHAGHIIPLIGEVYANADININISTSGDYPKVLESNNQGLTIKESRQKIEESNKRFQNFIKEMRSEDIVLLSSRWENQIYEDFYNLEHNSRRRKLFSNDGKQIMHTKALKILEYKLDKISEKLQEKGIKLVIFAPVPVFRGIKDPAPYRACHKEWFRPFTSKSCNSNFLEKREDIEDRHQSVKDTFGKIERKYSNVFIYDPFDLLCPSKTVCSSIINGTKIFRDDDHLSRDGAKYLYESFIEFLYTNNLLSRK